MKNGIHFIAGLPRAGSTLLAALLRQNPHFHAGMTSPVGSLYVALLAEMSGRNEFSVFIDERQRHALLAGLFDAYYQDIHPTKLVFDTNRIWCTKVAGLVQLFPRARIICCVRQVSWIIDSIERLVQRNPFEPSKIFGFDAGGTVYGRADGAANATGFVGYAYNALKEAFFGQHAQRLILVQYDSLTKQPAATLRALYVALGEPAFEHDFDNVVYDEAAEFDARLATPGLHTVGRRVRPNERPTILPPDVFRRFERDDFWCDPELNVHGVTVI
ncbi:MAG TPA: sulfotransferase [Candidatus Sulfotelmatobacter sp.]|nr:sulfotransferase [Candidatus Sulfotelmatobacter sp.]